MLTSARCSILALSVSALVLQSCASSGSPIVGPVAAEDPKPAESVTRMEAPPDYKTTLTNKINKYRAETYVTNNRNPISSHDVLHTAATRHAVYLNTENSAGYVPSNTAPSGVEGGATSLTSALTDLADEGTTPGAGRPYPTYFTATSMYNRVQAVVGGPSLLQSSSGVGKYVFENYIFNGNITTEDGEPSEFRGFNLDSYYNAIQSSVLDNDFRFDVVDNMWYTRRGRHALIQPTARYWGYGSTQVNKFNPPWPILNGRFLGVGMIVADRPLTQQYGYWPNNGQTDVNPYGLDTDLWEIEQEDGGDNQYGGPPIHFTLPFAEPFAWSGPGALSITFRCVAGYPAGWPERWKALAVYTNQEPTLATAGWSAASLDNAVTVTVPSTLLRESITGNPDLAPTNLRDGELIFQTLGPLPPNQEFRVTIQCTTTQSGVPINESWNFFTNANSAYNSQ